MNLLQFHIYIYMKGVTKLKQADISRLIELYGKKVYNFCLRLCTTTYDAEDLYQDTFLKAIEKLSSIDEDNNPSAYLCTIALSLWKSKTRKAARRHAIAPQTPIDEHFAVASDYALEEQVIKDELHAQVNAAVSSLEEKLRTCMLLHYVMEMPLGEIARILNIPEGTVKSRLHTARKLLKEQIAKGDLK